MTSRRESHPASFGPPSIRLGGGVQVQVQVDAARLAGVDQEGDLTDESKVPGSTFSRPRPRTAQVL